MANALKFQWSPDEAIEKLYKHGLFDNSNRGFLQTLIDNTIEIDDDTIAVQDADCPDRICIQQGKAQKPGDIIVCLPHKLLIEVKGTSPDGTTAVLPAR